jgi:GT2 family glycosyltransferase
MNSETRNRDQKVGFVVPTLGDRPDYLMTCLASIKAAGAPYIVLVSPDAIPDVEPLISKWIRDPKIGLSRAINLGIEAMPVGIEFVTWLGDDDELVPETLTFSLETLENDASIVATFGDVDYVDANGVQFWTNRSGAWAVPLMRVGPNRIPQPGSLVRRSALDAIGGIDEGLKFAMDLDMFIKLAKIGKLKHLNSRVARYRWHSDSLSAGQATKSLQESSRVRISHWPVLTRWLFRLLEKVHVTLASLRKSKLDQLSD